MYSMENETLLCFYLFSSSGRCASSCYFSQWFKNDQKGLSLFLIQVFPKLIKMVPFLDTWGLHFSTIPYFGIIAIFTHCKLSPFVVAYKCRRGICRVSEGSLGKRQRPLAFVCRTQPCHQILLLLTRTIALMNHTKKSREEEDQRPQKQSVCPCFPLAFPSSSQGTEYVVGKRASQQQQQQQQQSMEKNPLAAV